MAIRFQVSKPVLSGNEKAYVLDAVESGWISSTGSYLAKFEQSVGAFLGLPDMLACSNGTVALHLACLAMGLREGDDVLVPSLTYVASANAVAYCGARPVFVDCDPRTWNSTAAHFERAWTPRTVGVLAVHLYGLPCPADVIESLCRARNAWLIEDCAESLGARVRGRATGTFGDAATFSFYGNKTISTGEGGMLFVRDPERRKHARMLRGQGMDLERRYWHPIRGYNYRMTNVAAAIGLGQIEQVELHLAERRRVAARYHARLQPLAAGGMVQLPASEPSFESTHWLYCAVLASGGAARRDHVMRRLADEHGIETRPFFVPMHRLPMYAGSHPCPTADFLSTHGINLPTYTGLADRDIDEIADAFVAVVSESATLREDAYRARR